MRTLYLEGRHFAKCGLNVMSGEFGRASFRPAVRWSMCSSPATSATASPRRGTGYPSVWSLPGSQAWQFELYPWRGIALSGSRSRGPGRPGGSEQLEPEVHGPLQGQGQGVQGQPDIQEGQGAEPGRRREARHQAGERELRLRAYPQRRPKVVIKAA